MSAVTSANLMGITGIARRLVLDGALEEAAARKAMEGATAEKQPLASYLTDRRLVTPAALAAANSIEFGMPLVDALALDPSQSAIALVKDHGIKRGVALPVSAPFHCPLMQPAADAMAESRGYPDLDPGDCWEQWQVVRAGS